MNIFIQGAGRGIGLAFAKHALTSRQDDNWHMFLTARSPKDSEGYKELPPSANITWIAMDYLEPDSITKAGIAVAEKVDQLDRVISVAGVLRDPKVSPEKRIADLDSAAMLYAYQINAMGPVLLGKALWPLIKEGFFFEPAPTPVPNRSKFLLSQLTPAKLKIEAKSRDLDPTGLLKTDLVKLLSSK